MKSWYIEFHMWVEMMFYFKNNNDLPNWKILKDKQYLPPSQNLSAFNTDLCTTILLKNIRILTLNFDKIFETTLKSNNVFQIQIYRIYSKLYYVFAAKDTHILTLAYSSDVLSEILQ